MIRPYVRRHDGKTYGPFESRHDAMDATVDLHRANTYDVVLYSDFEVVIENEPDRLLPDPR